MKVKVRTAKELESLDLSALVPVKPTHAVAPRCDPFSIMRSSAFWEGAIKARGDAGPKMDNLYKLKLLAEEGQKPDITETEEFKMWLGYKRKGSWLEKEYSSNV